MSCTCGWVVIYNPSCFFTFQTNPRNRLDKKILAIDVERKHALLSELKASAVSAIQPDLRNDVTPCEKIFIMTGKNEKASFFENFLSLLVL
jgi:hypothetical protein